MKKTNCILLQDSIKEIISHSGKKHVVHQRSKIIDGIVKIKIRKGKKLKHKRVLAGNVGRKRWGIGINLVEFHAQEFELEKRVKIQETIRK